MSPSCRQVALALKFTERETVSWQNSSCGLIFFLFSSFFAGNVPIMNKKAKFESRANQLLNAPKVIFHVFYFLIHNIQIRCVFLKLFVFYDCICCLLVKSSTA